MRSSDGMAVIKVLLTFMIILTHVAIYGGIAYVIFLALRHFGTI